MKDFGTPMAVKINSSTGLRLPRLDGISSSLTIPKYTLDFFIV